MSTAALIYNSYVGRREGLVERNHHRIEDCLACYAGRTFVKVAWYGASSGRDKKVRSRARLSSSLLAKLIKKIAEAVS
jgi:ammonia channel protein AmtB